VHLDDCCGPLRDDAGRFRGRHPLPTREAFAERLAGWGWRPGRGVVAYDASGGMFAARLWWMLHWLGDPAVQVLDGGWAAWLADGGEVDAQPVVPVPQPVAPQDALSLPEPLVSVLTAEELQARLGRVRLLDARAPERFRGEVEPLDARAGHIPGARNRPFTLNLDASGRFKPAEVLRADWAPLLAGGEPPVHQCGSGVSACHNLLALAVAGWPLGPLYAGSWSEWSSDPTRPIAQG
jgi:thiosulfate/3-mercaptopyruvate sulfurtransferase